MPVDGSSGRQLSRVWGNGGVPCLPWQRCRSFPFCPFGRGEYTPETQAAARFLAVLAVLAPQHRTVTFKDKMYQDLKEVR